MSNLKILFNIFLFIAIAVLCNSNIAKAQILDDRDMVPPINMKQTRHTDSAAKKIFIFSIYTSIDDNAKIDSIYYSEISEPWELKEYINLKFIEDFFKSKKESELRKYKNCVIVTPVFVRSEDDLQGTYLSQLQRDFGLMLINNDKHKNKRILFNKPIAVAYNFYW